MSVLQPTFFLLLALSLLVLVHEWGHFYVARRSGVRVLRFSIGFGPEILGYTNGDTRYSICAIPFGGYVKFAGDNPEEERDEV
jgi:regulator of sigma E protease